MKELGTKSHEKLTPAGVKLLGNFIRSYKDSQGNPYMQQMLLLDVSRQQSDLDVSPPELDSLTETVTNLSLPSNHTMVYPSGNIITPDKQKEEFSTMWRSYLRILGFPVLAHSAEESELKRSLETLNNHSPNVLLSLIGTRMVRADYKYVVDRGRDKSYLREHAFKKISTGSAEYNGIYYRVADWVNSYDLLGESPKPEIPGLSPHEAWETAGKMAVLRDTWEERHPGESFIPEAA